MAYTVLARRYRSATFDEVVGQNHIAQTLKRAIEVERIAHAYLFCGTRGTGKTSMARIMAKALNCQGSDGPTSRPCLKCNSCEGVARGDDIDVIEIDAASNTGVDNIRELIENSQYRPARSRFKVYIIDEVHMLSKSAFNALLKTLEEPPSHVKFILATTEPEKVLPTILSRCQRYDFRNIPTREIAGHLKGICKSEQIDAADDALLMVAKAGAGSMRDSLSLLDRLLSIGEKELTTATIEELLGLPKGEVISGIVEAMGEGRVKDVLEQADAVVQGGLSVDSLLAALVDHFRNLLVLATCGAASGLVEVPGLSLDALAAQAGRFEPTVLTQDITILEELRRQIRTSQAGRALLDATLVRLALAEQFTAIIELLSRVGSGGGGVVAAQKKNIEPVGGRPAAAVAPAAASSFGRHADEGVGTTSVPVPVRAPAVSAPASGAGAPTGIRPAGPSAAAPASTAPVSAAPVVAAPMEIDLGEDDDLPRPGKVWESDGPSLAELMKQQRAQPIVAAPAPAAPRGEPSVEAVTDGDVARLWPLLLASLDGQGSVKGILEQGRLDRIEGDQAVIRLAPAHETFVGQWSRNGKKDVLQDVLSKIVGRTMGVRFEVDAAGEPPAAPAAAAATVPAGSAPPAARRASPAPAPPPPPAVPVATGTRPTPEQVEQFRQDPLIRALLDELGGTVLKVSDEPGP